MRRATRGLTALLAAVALVVACGCGGPPQAVRVVTPAAARRVAPTAAPPPTLVRVAGAGTLALPRATPDAVHLALFVDAGWRDATPPQLATATAWLAAARSPGVTARVEPDLVAWSVDCPRSRLSACTDQLAGMLALREADEDELVAVRRALVEARRRARTDEARTADGLAVAALLDVPQAGAFGEADDDARVDADAVARFAGQHLGPARALFVAAGDVDAATLAAAVETALAGVPDAAATRRGSMPPAARRSGAPPVRVVVGESEVVSVALRVDDAGRARAIAAQIAAEGTAPDATVRAFALRGGGVVLLRQAGRRRGADGAARWAAHTAAGLEMVRREVVDAAPAPVPDALDALVRAHGRAFATGDTWPGMAQGRHASEMPEDTHAIAAGVVVRGERTRRLRGPDPDDALAHDVESSMVAAIDARLGALDDADDATGDGTPLRNGARLVVQALPGAGERALAVRFAAELSAEHAGVLGRAGLTAEALAVACRVQLGRGGAALQAVVGAGSWGVLATARNDDALVHALRCVLDALPDDAAIDEARRRRVASLAPANAPALHARALAARALVPATPGLLAPEGTAESAASVPASEVRSLLARSRVGARAHVVWAGDGGAGGQAAQVARRLAGLDGGAPCAPPTHGDAAMEDVLAAEGPGPGVRAVIALRAAAPRAPHAQGDTPPDDGLDAQAFALSVATLLGEAPGVRVLAADGARVGPTDVAAWIALSLDESALAALAVTTRQALAVLDADPLGTDAVRRTRDQLAALDAASRAQPAIVADRLARASAEGVDATHAAGDDASLVRVVDALAAARLHVVVARPARPDR